MSLFASERRVYDAEERFCDMNSSARERRRLRILSGDSTGEKRDDSIKEEQPKGSNARARRRAKILKEEQAQLPAKINLSLKEKWGLEGIDFELLKENNQSYSGTHVNGATDKASRTVTEHPNEGKPEWIRFSDDSDVKILENKERLGGGKGNADTGSRAFDYEKLNASGLEMSLMEGIDKDMKFGSKLGYPGKENVSYARVLATLLPDEILKDINSEGAKQFLAAVLFADVSGFTELCEKFDKTGKGGPSRLTEILNKHIGAMIQVVLSRKGDVCKFGGDAILCFWKASSDATLKRVTCLAIDSAMDIQKNCQSGADVGVQIRVKIAIAAGEVMFSSIGERNRKYYVLVGNPVLETNRAEKLCLPGEVIVAPSAWKHVSNYLLYTYSLHSNKIHVLIQDYGPLWNQARGPDRPSLETPTFNMRACLKLSANLQLDDLRPFILPFVMKCIDNHEPLDYLTEMRQVAIVFLKLNISDLGLSSNDIVSFCDVAYQNVCNIVDKADGTVNKLTCFDKDVSILVVFGLKGFKYELASKTALKCAYNCIEKLKDFSQVSAGVTTGMVYCGVIGHMLRREYTVMGLPVNKAARLMCAFENIVSCDRETFLQSKLRSAHFRVLEQKPLKGIHNIGPLYEFSLNLKRYNEIPDSSSLPLLGRAKEIAEFEEFLKKYRSRSSIVNFFVVYGSARIGKTRLITSFINIAEKMMSDDDVPSEIQSDRRNSSNLEISFIPLSEDDYKTSYSTVRLIFQPVLGLNETSTAEEREEKIISKLGDVKDTYFLATLNSIFNVKFRFSKNYLSLNQEEQYIAKGVMKKRLYKMCFPSNSKWLIVIDDGEFIDEASWMFLKWCCTISSNPLFLITVGQQKALSASASECLLSIPQKKVVLTELDKWFYTALACQILQVKAIPVELENLLQGFKSSGNPGWLESYLLSLLQTESIQISYISSREMNSMKLVSVEEEVSSNSTDLPKRNDSPYWLDWVESFKVVRPATSEIIPVCILGPNFIETYNESELTMDMMHVKTFDKLKPVEQLILKAGSVLGYNFMRDAVRYLIVEEVVVEERAFAKAIKVLFEMRILSCDKGDFTCPSSLIMNRRAILTDNFQKDIKCMCIGLVKPEDLQNLPDYAACGFMRFRSPVFKDTVYNLLLDEQKKKFHQFSIDFLRNNTYRCKACHSVLFDHVLGQEIDNQLCLVCAKTPMHGVRSTKVKVESAGFNTPKMSVEDDSATQMRTSIGSQSDVGSLLNRDISDCQCPQILSTTYSALLEHAERAGRKDIMLEVSLEYASVSLTSYNIPLTAQIMERTLGLAEVIKEENEYPDLCTPFIFGKIYTLMGATNLSMGKASAALDLLKTAMKYLGQKIPTSAVDVYIRLKKVNFERRLIMQWSPKRLIGSASEKRAANLDLLSECLGLMCLVYMYAKNWLLAKFTSTWALNNALRSHRNFFGLCTSCANMMDVAYHYNDKITSTKMESLAISIWEHCSKQLLEVYELEAIARLYKMIFRARHLRAEIEDAIHIGFKSIRIAAIIRNSSLRLDLMPDMIFALIQLSRLSEAVSLLQELEFSSVQFCDKAGRTWYYAICMDFQLDTGYTILPYKACEKFVNEEEENFSVIRSIYATERLCTSLWLWCIRNGEWEASKRYATLMRREGSKEKMKTPQSVYTKLKQLEGLLITLVGILDNRNVHTNMTINSEIATIMKDLEKDTKIVPLLKPRYLLMKAYHSRIKYPKNSISSALHQARTMADKMKDKNTVDWIIHNKLVWRNATTVSQKTFWTDHCKYDNFVDWHEAETTFGKEAFMYSLPVPNT